MVQNRSIQAIQRIIDRKLYTIEELDHTIEIDLRDQVFTLQHLNSLIARRERLTQEVIQLIRMLHGRH